MTNFPVLQKSELDPEQRSLWDELTLGPRGFYTGGAEARRLPDLYNAWLQFPEFGRLMLRLGDETERARKTVSARVRDAVAKLDRVHPELAAHLRDALQMGTVCCYRPAEPTSWET